MSNEKIYVGGAKEVNGNFGAFHRISFNKQDLETLMNNLNAKGYVNLNMNKRRQPSQYGQTHSLTIDTWEPTQNQGGGYQQQAPQAQNFQQQAPQAQNFQQQAPPAFQQPSNDMADLNNSRPPVSDMPNFDDINDPEDCPF
ncbi:hypothetical protein PQO01_04890 [Lentisphaera marina]|uniref:hypothetical protein n=1 Tax=Lentisphaera marina TaxID=1111041 RepID=UPI0023651190|nr:hypothetical protein [Lentisphaera marina]MDD7984282.1 hypothetical protein [Lentisphaera marina]